MKTKNLEIGYLGEVFAKKYLQGKKYRIIKENYRTKYAEIDLIARDRKDILVFVEVKARLSERFGGPEESINRDKLKRLIRNAEAYVANKRYLKEYRIDAICIVFDENRRLDRIDHYENITL
ncbi:MAG TPA: YraN family protein [Candidatus Omnitrophica bacterium]|nr:YraN family protein [Candidatus Omnitrophota bacterium]